MTFTKGKRDIGIHTTRGGEEYEIPTSRTVKMRAYDRLRKRSYRMMENYYSVGSWQDGPRWSVAQHEAYVKGVRDALNG